MKEITVTNIMADGTECKDLSKYLETHELPDLTKRIIYQIMTGGAQKWAKDEKK